MWVLYHQGFLLPKAQLGSSICMMMLCADEIMSNFITSVGCMKAPLVCISTDV